MGLAWIAAARSPPSSANSPVRIPQAMQCAPESQEKRAKGVKQYPPTAEANPYAASRASKKSLSDRLLIGFKRRVHHLHRADQLQNGLPEEQWPDAQRHDV